MNGIFKLDLCTCWDWANQYKYLQLLMMFINIFIGLMQPESKYESKQMWQDESNDKTLRCFSRPKSSLITSICLQFWSLLKILESWYVLMIMSTRPRCGSGWHLAEVGRHDICLGPREPRNRNKMQTNERANFRWQAYNSWDLENPQIPFKQISAFSGGKVCEKSECISGWVQGINYL